MSKHPVSRRQFLKLGAAVAGNAAMDKTGSSQSVSVVDFGADRTGRSDATASITAALSHLTTKGGRSLIFPLGRYRLASPQHSALSFANYSNLEIDGQGSTLLMGNDALCLSLDRCSNVSIRNLAIDWEPLPYTQGTISDAGDGWFEVTLDDGFPAIPSSGILTIDTYDRVLRNIARNPVQIAGNQVAGVEQLSSKRARVRIARGRTIPTATVIVIRFQGNHDAIRLAQCQNVSFSGVNLYASGSMGYNISQSSNLVFHQCTTGFPAGSQRLLSTNADGMHITNCSGTLLVDQCIFEGMGDDAINVNAAMWRIQRPAGNSGATLVNRSGTPLSQTDIPGAQSVLEWMDPTDLHILQQGTLKQLASGPANVLVSDPTRVPDTTISHSQFRGNHSRAILAHSHLQVRNCIFQNTSLAAIMIAPDSHWMEGPATREIVIDSNQFSGCHYGSIDPEGTVTVDVQQTYGRRGGAPQGAAQDVKIADNIFKDCYTAAISCRSVDGLEIRGNQIGKTWLSGKGGPAIAASAIRKSVISGNTSSAANTIEVQHAETTTVADNRGFS